MLVTTPEEIFDLLLLGQKHRSVAHTEQNLRSSRSHTILVIELIQKSRDGDIKTGKLNLVDLAGSERTKSIGQTFEEAKVISPYYLLENQSEPDAAGNRDSQPCRGA